MSVFSDTCPKCGKLVGTMGRTVWELQCQGCVIFFHRRVGGRVPPQMNTITLPMDITSEAARKEWEDAVDDLQCSGVRRAALYKRYTVLRNRDSRSSTTPPAPITYVDGASGPERHLALETDGTRESVLDVNPAALNRGRAVPHRRGPLSAKDAAPISARFNQLVTTLGYIDRGWQKELTTKFQISASALYSMRSGKNMTHSLITSVAEAIGAGEEWLRQGTGDMLRSHKETASKPMRLNPEASRPAPNTGDNIVERRFMITTTLADMCDYYLGELRKQENVIRDTAHIDWIKAKIRAVGDIAQLLRRRWDGKTNEVLTDKHLRAILST